MSDSLRPHGLQHARLPCPSPSAGACSDSCLLSHPLSSASPPAFNPSQHQGLLQWVRSPHQVARVSELQHQSFQWIFGLIPFRMDWLDLFHRFYDVSWLNWSRIPGENEMDYASFRSHTGRVHCELFRGRCSGLDGPWQLHSLIWCLGGDGGKTGLSW